MEQCAIKLNSEQFDAAVHGRPGGEVPTLKECGDLEIIFKAAGTVEGRACAVITFTAVLPDGSPARAQCVTTARMLENVGAAIRGWRDAGLIKV